MAPPVRRSDSAGKPLLPPHEVALLVLLRQLDIQLPVKLKKQLRNWLAHLGADAVGTEFALSEALRVALTPEVAEAIERADEYARLRDDYIEQNPAIMGGEPVIRGTRVLVRTVAGLIEQGESREVMREDYPHVPEAAYPIAVLWSHANPRRGRPAPPWRPAPRGSASRAE